MCLLEPPNGGDMATQSFLFFNIIVCTPRSRVEKHCVDCFLQPACCQIIELCDLVRGVWRQSHYLGDNNQRFTYPVKLLVGPSGTAPQYTCLQHLIVLEAKQSIKLKHSLFSIGTHISRSHLNQKL